MLTGYPNSGKHAILAGFARHSSNSSELGSARSCSIAPIDSTRPHPLLSLYDEFVFSNDSISPLSSVERIVSPEEFQSRSASYLYTYHHPVLKCSYGVPLDPLVQLINQGISVLVLVPLSSLSTVEKWIESQRANSTNPLIPSNTLVRLLFVQTLSSDQLLQRLTKEDRDALSINETKALKSPQAGKNSNEKLATKRAKLTQAGELNVFGNSLPPPFAASASLTAASSANLRILWNGGNLQETVKNLIESLNNQTEGEKTSGESNSGESNSIAAPFALVSDYLISSIYPYLSPVLHRLEVLRPADPIEFVGLELLREWRERQSRIEQLHQYETTRRELREGTKKEYEVQGRV